MEGVFLYFSELNVETKTFDHVGTRTEKERDLLRAFMLSPPPIGLKLLKISPLQKSIEERINETEKHEKFKAEHLPMSSLTIGSFKTVAKNEGDLVAKCYYAKRKMVWEILENGLKKKIEITWQNISMMRPIIGKDGPEILEVELNEAPAFYREAAPTPGKHSTWTKSEDFTGGQASACWMHKHYLEFPPGVLVKHYDKLVQRINRVLQLCQRPSPRSQFDSQLRQGATKLSVGHDHLHGSNSNPASQQQPVPVAPAVSTQVQQFGNAMPIGINNSISPTSDIFSPPIPNEAINNGRVQNPALISQSQEISLQLENVLATDPLSLERDAQLHGPGSNNEELGFADFFYGTLLSMDDCDPETAREERPMANVQPLSTDALILQQEDPGLIAGANWWAAINNRLKERCSAINSNVNHVSDDQGVLIYPQPQQQCYSPTLHLYNENSEIRAPDTSRPPTAPEWTYYRKRLS